MLKENDPRAPPMPMSVETLRQHQLVYAALKGKMGGELHALALETSTPAGD